jgi:hypothetical protein
MRVYYMTSMEIATTYIFPEQRMKVSRFQDLNDPFELGCHDTSAKMDRLRHIQFSNTANMLYGLISFSDNWKSPVMWAHYANKNQGVCLGFDIDPDYIGHVKYTESRLVRPYIANDLKLIQTLAEMFFHKALEWSYERELRAIVSIDPSKSGVFHIPFSKTFQLREIVIGARSKLSPTSLSKAIVTRGVPVTIKKSRAARGVFEMVENKRYKGVVTNPVHKSYIADQQPKKPGYGAEKNPTFLPCMTWSPAGDWLWPMK